MTKESIIRNNYDRDEIDQLEDIKASSAIVSQLLKEGNFDINNLALFVEQLTNEQSKYSKAVVKTPNEEKIHLMLKEIKRRATEEENIETNHSRSF